MENNERSVAERRREREIKRKKKLMIARIKFAGVCAVILLVIILIIVSCSNSRKKQKAAKPTETSPAVSDTTPIETDPQQSQQPSQPVELAWNLLLVNAENPIPEDFSLIKADRSQLRTGAEVDSRCMDDLQKMVDDCRSAGHKVTVDAGYRSASDQETAFNKKVEELKALGYDEETAKKSAVSYEDAPGTSDYQTGLAVDIFEEGNVNRNEAQAENNVQKWLAENCWKYGFVVRFPADKEAATGKSYEPWHYRYVGTDAAKEMHEKNLCLEEYVATLTDTKE